MTALADQMSSGKRLLQPHRKGPESASPAERGLWGEAGAPSSAPQSLTDSEG